MTNFAQAFQPQQDFRRTSPFEFYHPDMNIKITPWGGAGGGRGGSSAAQRRGNPLEGMDEEKAQKIVDMFGDMGDPEDLGYDATMDHTAGDPEGFDDTMNASAGEPMAYEMKDIIDWMGSLFGPGAS